MPTCGECATANPPPIKPCDFSACRCGAGAEYCAHATTTAPVPATASSAAASSALSAHSGSASHGLGATWSHIGAGIIGLAGGLGATAQQPEHATPLALRGLFGAQNASSQSAASASSQPSPAADDAAMAPSSPLASSREENSETPAPLLRAQRGALRSALGDVGYSPAAVQRAEGGGELDEDYDSDDAAADAATATRADAADMRRERARERGGAAAGPPLHLPIDFETRNTEKFSKQAVQAALTVEEATKPPLIPLLKLHCQGSVVKCVQICEGVLNRIAPDRNIVVKARAFDQFAAAIELLRPPPTGFERFQREARGEVESSLGDQAAPASIEKEIGRRWKSLSKAERKRRNLSARAAVAFGYSATACEEHRKLYRFALKLVAPKKPAQLYDPSSPVPKVAALLGL
jgi:hypothetical protein